MGELGFKLRSDSRSLFRENKDTKEAKTERKTAKRMGVERSELTRKRGEPQTGRRPWSPDGPAW